MKSVKHHTQTSKPDDPNYDVSKDEWNEEHDVDMDHDELNNLDYASAGHTGFQSDLGFDPVDWTSAFEDLLTTGTITGESFSGWGIVPIGGVISWLKSFTGTPNLPDGFVECNGQVLNDSDSVYNGQTMPYLNANHRFLRGSTTSGSVGGNATHKHTFIAYNVGVSLGLVYYYFPANNTTSYVTLQPPYYEVVYVVRVK